MERRGMKKPLCRENRKKYWSACETMVSEMTESKRYSKGYSRIRLLRHLEANLEDPSLRVVDYPSYGRSTGPYRSHA